MSTTRTPEGDSNHCFVCKRDVVIEPSTVPTADASCPHCGSLLWFPEPGYTKVMYNSVDLSEFTGRIDEWVGRTKAPKLIIDFQDVDFIGSTVLGKLITLHRKLGTHGMSLGLKNIRPTILEVFRITKLDHLFEIDES